VLAGGAAALFLDRFDGTIRGERDVEAILGTPVLASVPSFPGSSATNGLVMLRATTGRRPAAARDSYRRLRSTLEFLAKRSDLKSFLITSPRPGDGKSTTVVNLAIAAAQTGRRVAIVSADMHRPSIERLLSLPTHVGISEYLLEESEAILTEVPSIPHLTAVTSGRPVETPAELLASSRVSELVKLLEENHDLVLFDTPPVLNASDSLALASRVDGVIVVADGRNTTTQDLEQLRDEMQLVGARIIGSVLNHHRLGLKRNTYAYGPTPRLQED
jgi:non-specific protein-tyrosine kinase